MEEREDYFCNLLLVALDYRRHCPTAAGQELLRQLVAKYRRAIVELVGTQTQVADALFILLGGMLVTRLLTGEPIVYADHAALVSRLLE